MCTFQLLNQVSRFLWNFEWALCCWKQPQLRKLRFRASSEDNVKDAQTYKMGEENTWSLKMCVNRLDLRKIHSPCQQNGNTSKQTRTDLTELQPTPVRTTKHKHKSTSLKTEFHSTSIPPIGTLEGCIKYRNMDTTQYNTTYIQNVWFVQMFTIIFFEILPYCLKWKAVMRIAFSGKESILNYQFSGQVITTSSFVLLS